MSEWCACVLLQSNFLLASDVTNGARASIFLCKRFGDKLYISECRFRVQQQRVIMQYLRAACADDDGNGFFIWGCQLSRCLLSPRYKMRFRKSVSPHRRRRRQQPSILGLLVNFRRGTQKRHKRAEREKVSFCSSAVPLDDASALDRPTAFDFVNGEILFLPSRHFYYRTGAK